MTPRMTLILVLLIATRPTYAAIAVSPSSPPALTLEQFSQASIDDLEQIFQTDFTWKEKLAVKIYQRKIKRQLRQHKVSDDMMVFTPVDERKQNQAALISGILGLISPLFFLYISLSVGFGAAIFAIIMGIISLAQFKRSPGTYKGKGWAIIGITGGIATLIILGILIAAYSGL